MEQNGLAPVSLSIESPGSSVFDLPVYQDNSLTIPRILSPSSSSELTATGVNQTSLENQSQNQAGHSYIVISGGTGGNSICSAFGNACYVLPVSDDGGSSSEIIRVIGGPSIGDIRSRLVRLIPSSPPGSPLDRIKHLLAYRLPAGATDREARDEWRDIVEGRSHLWSGIPPDRKELIRGFLVHFESEVLRRAQKSFSFRNGSIGNYFLAAALSFFRSLPTAIFLFSSITNSNADITPVIVTNHTVTIAAELENGMTIVGQCNISHPTSFDSSFSFSLAPSSPIEEAHPIIERTRNIVFSKDVDNDPQPLTSRIHRIYYINAYGHEIHPSPNPDFIANLGTREILVYSCGSLWTSIMPCLALKGVSSAIARSSTLRAKVLLLNTRNDRETEGYTAVDYLNAIRRTLNDQDSNSNPYTSYPLSAFVTHLVYLVGSSVEIDEKQIAEMGVNCIAVEVNGYHDVKSPNFDADCVRRALGRILEETIEKL